MSETLPISVLLLARDESGALASLLPALGFAHEVVVVWDPRGDPATAALARAHGARVLERGFDGFGPQRRFALAQCTQPWVLWVDADERPDADLVAAIRRWLATDPGSSGARLTRRTWFLGRPIRHCGWGDEQVLRLFRRERASFDDAPVHERVHVSGGIADLGGLLEHHSYETFEVCVEKLDRYARAGAERAWRAGRRAGPLALLVRPPLRFARQYGLQLGFLDGAHGLLLCGLAAAQVFLKYAWLWERGRANAAPTPGPEETRA